MTIMKGLMQKTLGSRVPGLWFMLACLLLVCTLTRAIRATNQVVRDVDGTFELITQPTPTHRAPSPLASPNPATIH